MALKYSMQRNDETLAKAKGANLPISLKYSIEICNYIRGDKIARAIQKLEASIAQEIAIPFKRFTDGVGHRKGNDILSGRYAVKACTHILKLLNSAKSNAVFKGLNIDNLVIVHAAASQAPQAWHHGRQRRQRVKKCHVELVLEEVKTVKEAKLKAKETTKKAPEMKPKTEDKTEKVVKTEEVKEDVKVEVAPNVEESVKEDVVAKEVVTEKTKSEEVKTEPKETESSEATGTQKSKVSDEPINKQ